MILPSAPLVEFMDIRNQVNGNSSYLDDIVKYAEAFVLRFKWLNMLSCTAIRQYVPGAMPILELSRSCEIAKNCTMKTVDVYRSMFITAIREIVFPCSLRNMWIVNNLIAQLKHPKASYTFSENPFNRRLNVVQVDGA